MKVKDVMTATARTCGPATSLAEAAALMLDEDCGFLPVVDRGHLVGVVTDRDLYIALATRNALAVMREHRVRRLPVTGFGETVLGVISMNDILLAAGPKRPVSSTEVLDALQEICGHHHPAPHVSVA